MKPRVCEAHFPNYQFNYWNLFGVVIMHLPNCERGWLWGKKQSKSSKTNMPLNLLMSSTSPYYGSPLLAITLWTSEDSWCSCLSTGQVVRSCVQTCTICYFYWSVTHTESVITLDLLFPTPFLFTRTPPRTTCFTGKDAQILIDSLMSTGHVIAELSIFILTCCMWFY